MSEKIYAFTEEQLFEVFEKALNLGYKGYRGHWTMDSVDQLLAYLSGFQAPKPAIVPSIPEILDVIFENDGDTIEEDGPIGMRIAKALQEKLLDKGYSEWPMATGMGDLVRVYDEAYRDCTDAANEYLASMGKPWPGTEPHQSGIEAVRSHLINLTPSPARELKEIGRLRSEIRSCRDNLAMARDMATDQMLDALSHRINAEIARLHDVLMHGYTDLMRKHFETMDLNK